MSRKANPDSAGLFGLPRPPPGISLSAKSRPFPCDGSVHAGSCSTCLTVSSRETSTKGLILCAKMIRQQLIRYSHSIQMDYRLALKCKLISLVIDCVKRGDKKLYLVVAYGPQKLYFIDLLDLDSSNHLAVTQHIAPIIRALSTYSICVN
jgi:hypothetical protein